MTYLYLEYGLSDKPKPVDGAFTALNVMMACTGPIGLALTFLSREMQNKTYAIPAQYQAPLNPFGPLPELPAPKSAQDWVNELMSKYDFK
jgi:hypothetical protein